MTQDRVQILLEIRDKLDGLTKARQQVKGLAGDMGGLKGALMGGLGLGAGFGVFGAIERGVGLAVGGFKAMVSEGIRFNAVMESSRIGIAAVLTAVSPDRFKTVADALATAGDITDQIKERAKTTAASYEGLIGAFQSLAAPMNAAGVPLGRQVELSALIADAVKGMGMPDDQIAQEGRALLEGRIDRSVRLARMVPGLTPEAIKQAADAGKTFEFFQEKLGAFAQAGRLASDSFAVLTSNLKDLWSQTTAEGMKPAFDAIKDLIRSLTEYLSDQSIVDAMRGLGLVLAEFFERLRDGMFLLKLSPIGMMLEQMGRTDRLNDEVAAAAAKRPEAVKDVVKEAAKPALQKSDTDLIRGELEFALKNNMISLADYSAERMRLVVASLSAGLIDAGEAAKERQGIELAMLQKSVDQRRGLIDSLFSSATVKPAAGSFGMFGTTGQAAAYAAQQDTSRRILDVLVEIRNELRGGVTLDMATL